MSRPPESQVPRPRTDDAYGQLTAKIDAFFTRVESRHGDDMQCATGCSDCCHVRLSITSVEARAIAAHLAVLPSPTRTALAAYAKAAAPDRCAALDAGGRCQIYEVRPVICRSHGAPIRTRVGSLPVIQNCHHNFTQTVPAADCVLDQETLSALTLVVDRAEGGDGTRVDLAKLLADA